MTPGGSIGTTIGAGGILSVDLDAIAANYRTLCQKTGNHCATGAVVKADAYGLGMGAIAPVLHDAGCRQFFVAIAEEGLALRALMDDAEIYVFNGVDDESAAEMAAAGLVPVLNHRGQIETWQGEAKRRGKALPAVIHVDTGMNRLGLNHEEAGALGRDKTMTEGLDIRVVMSHLACADEGTNKKNAEQLEAFGKALEALAPLGALKATLANSSGIFLGADYHFDLVRPGAALYGISPLADGGQASGPPPNPMAQVVRLQGKILQTRVIDTPSGVGYGASHQAERGHRIATVGVGYADGYLRSLSNSASAIIGGIRVPVVGRVSMDLITLDVTAVAEDETRPGALVELMGPDHPVDVLAREAGTIGYEILTALGHRYERRYHRSGA